MRVTTQSLQAHSRSAAMVSQIALHIEAVALVYRSGSRLNEHMHFRVCVVEGVLDDRSNDHWNTRKRVFVAGGLQPKAD